MGAVLFFVVSRKYSFSLTASRALIRPTIGHKKVKGDWLFNQPPLSPQEMIPLMCVCVEKTAKTSWADPRSLSLWEKRTSRETMNAKQSDFLLSIYK